MKTKVWPWKSGDSGVLCMPKYKNINEPPQKDWKLVKCPICGDSCWESDKHRELIKNNFEVKAACTECALRAGLNGGVADG